MALCSRDILVILTPLIHECRYHSIYFYHFEFLSSMSFSFVNRFLVKFITKYFIIFDALQWKPDWRCTGA